MSTIKYNQILSMKGEGDKIVITLVNHDKMVASSFINNAEGIYGNFSDYLPF